LSFFTILLEINVSIVDIRNIPNEVESINLRELKDIDCLGMESIGIEDKPPVNTEDPATSDKFLIGRDSMHVSKDEEIKPTKLPGIPLNLDEFIVERKMVIKAIAIEDKSSKSFSQKFKSLKAFIWFNNKNIENEFKNPVMTD